MSTEDMLLEGTVVEIPTVSGRVWFTQPPEVEGMMETGQRKEAYIANLFPDRLDEAGPKAGGEEGAFGGRKVVLDIASGRAIALHELSAKYPESTFIGVDANYGPTAEVNPDTPGVQLTQDDWHALDTIPPGSVDTIISSIGIGVHGLRSDTPESSEQIAEAVTRAAKEGTVLRIDAVGPEFIQGLLEARDWDVLSIPDLRDGPDDGLPDELSAATIIAVKRSLGSHAPDTPEGHSANTVPVNSEVSEPRPPADAAGPPQKPPAGQPPEAAGTPEDKPGQPEHRSWAPGELPGAVRTSVALLSEQGIDYREVLTGPRRTPLALQVVSMFVDNPDTTETEIARILSDKSYKLDANRVSQIASRALAGLHRAVHEKVSGGEIPPEILEQLPKPTGKIRGQPAEIDPSMVGPRLKTFFGKVGVTQEKLAEDLDWSRSKVSRMLNGVSHPNTTSLRGLLGIAQKHGYPAEAIEADIAAYRAERAAKRPQK